MMAATAQPASELAEKLYRRQAATLVASWRVYARHSAGASVAEKAGAAVCLFPAEPERGIYNNALLDRGMDAERAARAVDSIEAAYRDAGIDRYAVWAHESEPAPIAELTDRVYRFDTSTRAMAMPLERLASARPELEPADLDWEGYVRSFGVPDGLLAGIDAAELRHRHGADRSAASRPPRVGLHDGEPPVDPDDRGRLRLARLPRPRPLPRVRAGRLTPAPAQ
jgi:hypothetical protein